MISNAISKKSQTDKRDGRAIFWTGKTEKAAKLSRRIEETDPYFQMVHTQWGEGLRRVFAQLPDPDWT